MVLSVQPVGVGHNPEQGLSLTGAGSQGSALLWLHSHSICSSSIPSGSSWIKHSQCRNKLYRCLQN